MFMACAYKHSCGQNNHLRAPPRPFEVVVTKSELPFILVAKSSRIRLIVHDRGGRCYAATGSLHLQPSHSQPNLISSSSQVKPYLNQSSQLEFKHVAGHGSGPYSDGTLGSGIDAMSTVGGASALSVGQAQPEQSQSRTSSNILHAKSQFCPHHKQE